MANTKEPSYKYQPLQWISWNMKVTGCSYEASVEKLKLKQVPKELNLK